MSPGGYFNRLPSGLYVSWEVFGDMLEFGLLGRSRDCRVRVLGVGRSRPRTR